MGIAAVIYKKGADNFGWEEIKVGSPEQGHVRLRSRAVGVNFADTYHRAGIPRPMIVGSTDYRRFRRSCRDRGVGS
jgi:NADPH:quinone reductase-like Zn-dependent oxidoreductase